MMQYSDMLHRCFRCGYCKLPADYSDLTCPAYLNYRFETYSPGGRMWLLRAWLTNEIETSSRLGDILYSCATCASCTKHCVFPKFKDDLLNAILAGREKMVEEGLIPPAVRDYLKAVHITGNAYKRPQSERDHWARGLNIASYDGHDYLLFVGDVGSFDERGQRMTRAVAELLTGLGVSFGILGSDEKTDGNDVRALGEFGLFELVARENLETFKQRGVSRIITVSPHAYNVFSNNYPSLNADLTGNFLVRHYSQVLQDNLDALGESTDQPPLRVTFHDPCYLGRHNQEYWAPRKILNAIPGIDLVEMDRTRQNTLCCGGGGGNFFTDILGRGPDAPARVRVREAAETQADILVVACPSCAKMLEDAAKVENLDHQIRILDLAELALERRPH